MKRHVPLIALTLLTLAWHSAVGADEREERNKKIVIDFYDKAINQKDFDAASVHLGSKYIQHNPLAADGPEGLKAFLVFAKENLKTYRTEFKRVLADGAVYVPSRVDPDTGQAAEVAIPDAITVLASRGHRHRQVYHLSAAHSGPPTTVYELHGSQGALRIAGGRLYRAGARDREWTQVEIAPGMAADWEVEAQFVASIREGRPVTLTSFEDGARYMEFTEAAWRSWQEGRAMSLPLRD